MLNLSEKTSPRLVLLEVQAPTRRLKARSVELATADDSVKWGGRVLAALIQTLTGGLEMQWNLDGADGLARHRHCSIQSPRGDLGASIRVDDDG